MATATAHTPSKTFSLNIFETLPAKINEARNGDNLVRLSHVILGWLHSSGWLDKPTRNMDYYWTARQVLFFAEAAKILQLPHLWFHTVTGATIERSDILVNSIIKALRTSHLDKQKAEGKEDAEKASAPTELFKNKEFLKELDFHVRGALDELFIDGKGYTVKQFKSALASNLSERLSHRKDDNFIVNLDELSMTITLAHSSDRTLYEKRNFWDIALLVAQSVQAILINLAVIQDWNIGNAASLMDKVGLKEYFTTLIGQSTTSCTSSLIYTSLIATLALKALVCLGKISKMKDVEKIKFKGKVQSRDNFNKKMYLIFTAGISSAVGMIYIFNFFRLDNPRFHSFIAYVRIGDLLGNIFLSYSPPKFSHGSSEKERVKD